MDDGLILQLCQHEESRAARIIRNTTQLFTQFIRYLAIADWCIEAFCMQYSGVIFGARISYKVKRLIFK